VAEFTGKVALVTGAGSGIGRATAIAYAREGAQVIVSDVNDAPAAETVAMIRRAGGDADVVIADVSSAEACAALVERTLARYGRLDCACNNAGIAGDNSPIADMPVESWNRVIAVNLSSVFYCLKYEIPAILRSGGGSIVNMASILGAVGFAKAAAYVSAKHGLLGLTQNAALEYSAQGIRTNAVGPAFIKTPLIKGFEEAVLPLHPIGRLGEAEEVAELVVFLTSPRASFISGAYIPIDGAYLAR
jgi:NAD(P)-dependent dehydrogenase (short-subunit alcohol dehydrogenase family)